MSCVSVTCGRPCNSGMLVFNVVTLTCFITRYTKYVVRMSRDSYLYMKRFLNEKNMTAMLTIIQENLTIDGIIQVFLFLCFV